MCGLPVSLEVKTVTVKRGAVGARCSYGDGTACHQVYLPVQKLWPQVKMRGTAPPWHEY